MALNPSLLTALGMARTPGFFPEEAPDRPEGRAVRVDEATGKKKRFSIYDAETQREHPHLSAFLAAATLGDKGPSYLRALRTRDENAKILAGIRTAEEQRKMYETGQKYGAQWPPPAADWPEGRIPGSKRDQWFPQPGYETDEQKATKAAKVKRDQGNKDVGRAVSLADPNLVPDDYPDAEQIRWAIKNQYAEGAPIIKQDVEGVWTVSPGPTKHKPFVPPMPGAGPPGGAGGGIPGHTAPRTPTPGRAPAAPGAGGMGGGPPLVPSHARGAVPLFDQSGRPLQGPAPQNLQGMQAAISNSRVALRNMQMSYDASRKHGLGAQTVGAMATGVSTAFPSLRGVTQEYTTSGKDATIHEMNRKAVAGIAARVIGGTVRAQWLGELLEQIVPHFTDAPEVAANFYGQFGEFLKNAETMPWAHDPVRAREMFGDALEQFATGYAARAGLKPPPAPGTAGGHPAPRRSLDDIWRETQGGP